MFLVDVPPFSTLDNVTDCPLGNAVFGCQIRTVTGLPAVAANIASSDLPDRVFSQNRVVSELSPTTSTRVNHVLRVLSGRTKVEMPDIYAPRITLVAGVQNELISRVSVGVCPYETGGGSVYPVQAESKAVVPPGNPNTIVGRCLRGRLKVIAQRKVRHIDSASVGRAPDGSRRRGGSLVRGYR